MENTNVLEPFSEETLTESGQAPKQRFKDPHRVRSLARRVLEGDEERLRFDTRLKRCRDGERPYSQAKLKQHGQGWRWNYNAMEYAGHRQAAQTPYHDLIYGGTYMAEVRLKLPDPTVEAEKSQIVTEEYDRMMRSWHNFNTAMNLACGDRLDYGKGFMMWDDIWDAEPNYVNRFNVHAMDRTNVMLDKAEILVIDEDMPVDKLWEKIKDSGKAAFQGYDVKECKDAIRRAKPPTDADEDYRPDKTQQSINDRDILDSLESSKIKVAHVLVKEYAQPGEMEGKISHWIVERDNVHKPDDLFSETKKPKGQLFYKNGRFEKWARCFWASFMDLADGSWNGTSGLGKQIIQQVEAKNRLWCSAGDLIMFRSAINMRATSEGSYSRVHVLQHGPINVYPPGYEMMNAATYVGDVAGVMSFNDAIEQSLGQNTGVYRQRQEKPKGNPETATAAMVRNQNAVVLSNAQVMIFYSDLDKLHAEIYRRVVSYPNKQRSDAAREFLKCCEERGVAKEELKEIRWVRAYRNIGNGSQIMRQQNLAQLSPIVPYFPQKGQMQWARDTSMAVTNLDATNRYMPMEPGADQTIDHDISTLENDSLKNGSQPNFRPDQNHVIHAQKHIEASVAALGSVQQGADPSTVLAFLEAAGPHTLLHIKQLQNNPVRQTEAKLLLKQWADVAKATEVLRKNAEKIVKKRKEQFDAQQKAQAIQDMQDPETAVVVAKQQLNMRIAEQRNEMRHRHEEESHRAKLARDDASTASEITRSTAKTTSDIASQRAKSAPAEPATKSTAQASKPQTTKKKVTFKRDNDGKLVAAEVVDESSE